MVEHFYDHKNENSHIGLGFFLAMHYFIEDGTDKDANEDNRLPFKSTGTIATISFMSLTPPRSIEIIAKPAMQNNSSFGIDHDSFLCSQYLAAIWQPPRTSPFIPG